MNDLQSDEQCDVVVIGGGPGGSTVATMVAMQGWKVVLLERERFPRYQIGESLLPSTIHGICVMLGVSEELKRANFTYKLGGTFRWGKNDAPWTFNFGSSSVMAGPRSFAYQVERSKFDNILLENARRKGVDVREECTVKDVIEENGRVVGVRYADKDGVESTIRARFVADASGNTSRIAQRVGERVYSKFFQNIALFGYYENGKRLPAPNNGNILCAAFDGGWFWYIPLSDSLTSVGAVVSRDHADLFKQDYEEAMRGFIASCPLIQEYLAGATRVTEGDYGKLRVRKDYSYSNSAFWKPGVVLVGDAACFIDPVFSSGVHLATYSALLAARSINSCLRGGIDESRAFDEFERRYRREFANFYQFLLAFYDMHEDEDSYFWAARKVLSTDEPEQEAFVRLVGGVSSSGERLYDSFDEFFERRHAFNAVFDKLADGAPDPITAAHAADREAADLKPEALMNELTRESVQLQVLGVAKTALPEKPMFDDGLVPSMDGYHWSEPRTAGRARRTSTGRR